MYAMHEGGRGCRSVTVGRLGTGGDEHCRIRYRRIMRIARCVLLLQWKCRDVQYRDIWDGRRSRWVNGCGWGKVKENLRFTTDRGSGLPNIPFRRCFADVALVVRR